MTQDPAQMDFVAYVEQAAILTKLPIVPHYVEGVVENLEQIAAIAHLVSEFPLPEEIETVPVFEP
ncbi:DUF4089 domain-containing protein [Spirulina sp. CS-785/01]|uniref:DUF4089 domain-containing protein n=1 Tax=Spirulina sp. CS-785/01 TaxID=3021716 RepID=UPI00232B10A4|nr:DUF4089 domain-containing protein [Spirulina sp. CS-785/01]MDB9313532.1 DUF4089 domain-containing protein [Spirulina sp. CS-785/01]